MIATIDGLPRSVIGMRGVGTITVDDFLTVVVPRAEQLLAGGIEIRLIFHLGPEFDRFGEGAWGDLTSELTQIRFRRGAMVSDDFALTTGLNMLAWTLSGEVRTFRNDHFDRALDWVTG